MMVKNGSRVAKNGTPLIHFKVFFRISSEFSAVFFLLIHLCFGKKYKK